MRPVLLAAAAALSMGAATSERAGPPASLSRQVQPIFDRKCVACHQEGAAQAGLSLEQGQARSALVGRRSTELNMMLVAPAAPDASYLMLKVSPDAGGRRRGAAMPLGGSLEPAEIAIIRQWIVEGAQNN